MECPFCEEFENKSSFKEIVPEWPYDDRIIVKNELAMAFPGLGPVAPDAPYVLVIPKGCHPSFLHASPEERDAMFDLVDHLFGIKTLFPSGRALIFEHGGIAVNSGCKCIDHCHIHVMNIAGPWVRLPDILADYHRDEAVVLTAKTPVNSMPYLFAGHYKSGDRSVVGRIAHIRGCREPQFFRALIGRMTGNDFDYRHRNNMHTMIRAYEEAKKFI